MNKVIIIAEAGVNHNADFNTAKKLIDVASESGADYVKFQTAVPHLVVTKEGAMADYQIENLGQQESQLEMTKKIHLPLSDFEKLAEYAKEKNIKFASTPFDLVSVDALSKLNMDFFKIPGITLAKIPSGEVTNYPYLKKVAQLFKEVILSTGMADIQEIKDAIAVLTENGILKENITVLHCNTEYPTPMEDVNLRAMLHLQKELGVAVGYSDHTLGIEVPIAAVALGATVIEKHFTLDKNLPGPDHKASLEPNELKAMVEAIRNIEKAMAGSGVKEPSASEIKNKPIARRSIVAKTAIKKGAIFTEENLIVKRPGTGISPMKWNEILGQTATRDFEEDELIEL
ncbi:MAG: N-acetylneuraminate synthase [Capnocytophaga sp.]|nr:N-acetylneuraminate synthase [Capnocytophaga sp.]